MTCRRIAFCLTLSFLLPAVVIAQDAPEPPPPPCSSPAHREFDFWLGEWSVRNTAAPADRPAARNSITRVHGGCAIREEYHAPNGYSGTSVSFYDAARESWHQTWIDNQGRPIYLDGGRRGDSMVLTERGDDGRINRVTWTPLPGGRVRQLWEASADDGKVWKVVFDGIYEKRE